MVDVVDVVEEVDVVILVVVIFKTSPLIVKIDCTPRVSTTSSVLVTRYSSRWPGNQGMRTMLGILKKQATRDRRVIVTGALLCWQVLWIVYR